MTPVRAGGGAHYQALSWEGNSLRRLAAAIDGFLSVAK